MKREHIIAEIQRTAAQNGGVPLGVRRFLRETGIKDKDWLGKYRLRWGDALREAGLEPNTFTEGYSDADLLEKLAAYVRELGHFPIRAELTMKSQRDRGFQPRKYFALFAESRGRRFAKDDGVMA